MYKQIFSIAVLVLGSLALSGCVVDDEVVDGDPDTTVVNPPAPDNDTDVIVTPPAGGGDGK
jgi:hypothetical protein